MKRRISVAYNESNLFGIAATANMPEVDPNEVKKVVPRQTINESRLRNDKVSIGNLSIAPQVVHYYQSSADGFKQSAAHKANEVKLAQNSHCGYVSDKSRAKLEMALQWLLYVAQPKRVYNKETDSFFSFKVNFMTFTLSAAQVHSDQEISSRCLSNLLDVLRKECKVSNYIWRAEAQANGNIHYHIVTDTYVHYDKLRNIWNKSQQLLGYVSAFSLKNGHANPNSTDIHSVKHVRNLASYLSKYIGKNKSFACIGELRNIDGELKEVLYGSDLYKKEKAGKKVGKVVGHVLGGQIRAITSRLWGCNRELSKMKSIKVAQHDLNWYEIKEAVKKCDYREFKGEYITTMYGSFESVCDLLLNSKD